VNDLTYFQALVLGVLQGLTEFLPVSSSAHLALSQQWMGLDPSRSSLLFFDLLTHIGTLASVGVVFAVPIRRYLQRLVRECRTTWPSDRRYALRIAGLGILATLITGAIGLSFQSTFEAAFARPRWIGLGLLVTGALLFASGRLPRGRRRWKEFRWWQAAAVGLAQAVAIFPGISRSGSTISVATYCGLRRQWSAQFSFLLAFPAILGAALKKGLDVRELPADQAGMIAWGPIAAGSLIAFVVGVIALILLLNMVRRAKLHYFSWYCWVLGGTTLIVGLASSGRTAPGVGACSPARPALSNPAT
jgi:undecaprenyl-diphosphatase